MLEFQEKRKKQSIVYSRLSIAVLLIVFLLSLKGAITIWMKERESNKNKQEAVAKVEELQKRQEFLEASVARLKTNEGVEREIREKFRVKKEGEEMVLLVDPKIDTLPVTAGPESGFLKKVLDWFTF